VSEVGSIRYFEPETFSRITFPPWIGEHHVSLDQGMFGRGGQDAPKLIHALQFSRLPNIPELRRAILEIRGNCFDLVRLADQLVDDFAFGGEVVGGTGVRQAVD